MVDFVLGLCAGAAVAFLLEIRWYRKHMDDRG